MNLPKHFLIDQQIQNNPLKSFVFHVRDEGKAYERKVYDLNDMLGNVGGIFSILQTLAGFIVYVLCDTSLDT